MDHQLTVLNSCLISSPRKIRNLMWAFYIFLIHVLNAHTVHQPLHQYLVHIKRHLSDLWLSVYQALRDELHRQKDRTTPDHQVGVNMSSHSTLNGPLFFFFSVSTKQVLLTSEDCLCCSVEPQEMYFGILWLAFFLRVPPGAVLFLSPASIRRQNTFVCCGYLCP